MVKVIAEVIGIIGIICSILSFQCSQRKNVMLFQVFASLMFCTQLFLVGAVTGACLDSINFFRSLFFSIDKKWAKSNWWLALFILFLLAAGIATWAKCVQHFAYDWLAPVDRGALDENK